MTLNAVSLSDLELIGNGAFSPLTGFLGQDDYRSVVDEMHLANGTVWSIPITLAVTREVADGLPAQGEVALRDDAGRIVGILELAEKYKYDGRHEAQQVFRTDEEAHPGVARIYSGGEVYLAGDVHVLNGPENPRLRRTGGSRRRRARSSRSGAGAGSWASRPAIPFIGPTST